jgi:hypothetical protein
MTVDEKLIDNLDFQLYNIIQLIDQVGWGQQHVI